MRITDAQTTVEVQPKAFTTLAVEGVVLTLGARTGRVERATVYWERIGARWQVSFVHLVGPYLRKRDGSDSLQRFSEHRSFDLLSRSLPALVPRWRPVLGACPYPVSIGTESRAGRGVSFADGTAEDTIAPDLVEERGGARLTHLETTTQLLLSASTTIRIEDYDTRFENHTVRIKRARARWFFEREAWSLETVDVWGPIIRASDGAESTRHVDELTTDHAQGSARYPQTPPDLLAEARKHEPTWIPTVTPSPYPPNHELRTSIWWPGDNPPPEPTLP